MPETSNPGSTTYYSQIPISVDNNYDLTKGFTNKPQYWAVYGNGNPLDSLKNAGAVTRVSSGLNCAVALQEPGSPEIHSKLVSDTSGTCCLTNDLIYLACYACFDCVKLAQNLRNTLEYYKLYSCNPATGVVLYRDCPMCEIYAGITTDNCI